MENLINSTGVPTKKTGDGLKSTEVNAINNETNNAIKVSNIYLKDRCNINIETSNLEKTWKLSDAIELVPSYRRNASLEVKFLGESGDWEVWEFLGGDYNDLSSWVSIGTNIIDGGIW